MVLKSTFSLSDRTESTVFYRTMHLSIVACISEEGVGSIYRTLVFLVDRTAEVKHSGACYKTPDGITCMNSQQWDRVLPGRGHYPDTLICQLLVSPCLVLGLFCRSHATV